jgi:hypothetical protein
MSLPGEDKKLTVCVYIDGERSRAALSLIDTLLATPSLGKTWELLIAIDSPSYELQHIIKQEYRHKKKAVFFESQARLGNTNWWRVMLANVRSEYAFLLDDSALPSPAWIPTIFDYMRDNPAAHLCGFKYGRGIEAFNPELPYVSPLKDGAILLNTAFYREHEILPSDKAHIVGSQAVFFDFSMAASLGVFPDAMQQLDISSVFTELPKTDRDAVIDPKLPLISICICTYGHHPELILRCLDSILGTPHLKNELEIILGCNAVSDEVMQEIDRRCRDGGVTTLIRSPLNYNKSGMQRFMFRIAQAPYILSLDDDMYFQAGWLPLLREHIQASHPVEVMGRLHALSNRTLWSGQKKPYDSYCQKKRWWRGKRPYGLEVVFPAGQCFLARTKFVIENDYPDLDMRIDWDDVLLGDLVTQLDGKQIWFPDELIKLILVDDIPSRGSHGGG